MGKLGKPITQRQLRVGEMIKQALSMIFLKDEAKLPNVQTKGITVTEVRMSPDLKTAKTFVLLYFLHAKHGSQLLVTYQLLDKLCS